MKFFETNFNEYINTSNQENLHPSFNKSISNFPENIENLKNIIFYGAPGIGKYTQVLHCIKKYSQF